MDKKQINAELIAIMKKQILNLEEGNRQAGEMIERIESAIARRNEEIADLRKRIVEVEADQ